MPRPKPLASQIIVVTGATSGIGLTTATRAARAGTRVVLVARGEADLRTICGELTGRGARDLCRGRRRR